MDEVPEEIENYIQAAAAEPAMEESAIFDAVVDIVVGAEYDYYIYDLVPLGHALYYLSMASVYDEWIDKITKLREEMQEYAQVAAMHGAQGRIRGRPDPDRTAGHQATHQHLLRHPDRPRQDRLFLRRHAGRDDHPRHAQSGSKLFAKYQVPICGYIVNRVIPPELAQQNIPEYLRNRIDNAGEIPQADRRYLRQRGLGTGARVRTGHHRPGDDRQGRGRAVRR